MAWGMYMFVHCLCRSCTHWMEDSNEVTVKRLPTTELIGRFGLLTPAITLVPKIEGVWEVVMNYTIILATCYI